MCSSISSRKALIAHRHTRSQTSRHQRRQYHGDQRALGQPHCLFMDAVFTGKCVCHAGTTHATLFPDFLFPIMNIVTYPLLTQVHEMSCNLASEQCGTRDYKGSIVKRKPATGSHRMHRAPTAISLAEGSKQHGDHNTDFTGGSKWHGAPFARGVCCRTARSLYFKNAILVTTAMQRARYNFLGYYHAVCATHLQLQFTHFCLNTRY